MENKESLTTEDLRLKFKSQFELVNYSIRLAENMIKSGREPRVKVGTQSAPMQVVLAEIKAGKDIFEDIPSSQPVQPPQEQRTHHHDRADRFDRQERMRDLDHSNFETDRMKNAGSKKGRKILAD